MSRFLYWILFLSYCSLYAPFGAAEEAFAACVADLQRKARQQGLGPKIVDEVLGGVKFAPKVIELDRRQPEGDMPVLDSLATLACDQRRSEFFTTQLLTALHLIGPRGVEPDQMQGSWAGAMGHTQFMPETYKKYAVDGDGDSRVDLWNSIPDAMASAANFLAGLGWKTGLRWGREVVLPENFTYKEVGIQNRRPLNEWRELGIVTAFGGPIPQADVQAALLVPAGHQGPAFLVYDNFDVIMEWNRSEFYALAVGYLADRINGGGTLKQPPPDQPPLSIAQVKELQTRLNTLGFEAGEPDGILGPGTRRAIRALQHQRDMVADGYPAAAVLKELGISLE
ncbi:MAG: lytic murein transglycosylase [Exilibacterium sp.]